MKVLTKKDIKITFLVVFAYKLICANDEFTKPIVVFSVENAAYKFIEAIFKEFENYQKVVKKHF